LSTVGFGFLPLMDYSLIPQNPPYPISRNIAFRGAFGMSLLGIDLNAPPTGVFTTLSRRQFEMVRSIRSHAVGWRSAAA
jgi:hypothetical protein